MKLIPITEAQAEQFKKFGIEPEICYAIPESLFNLVSGLGKKKRRLTKAGTNTHHNKGGAKINPNTEYLFYPEKCVSRDSSHNGAAVIKTVAYGVKSGEVVTRGFIYKLIPKAKQAWVTYDLIRQGVLVPE